MCSTGSTWTLLQVGCPIRKSPDQYSLAAPRGLSQQRHVLLRPLVPRHPPCALRSLTSYLHCSTTEHGGAQGVSLSAFVLKRSPVPPAGGARRRHLWRPYSRRLFVMGRYRGHARPEPRRRCRPGDGRARTADPLLAKQVLSQLSYIPVLPVMTGTCPVARRLRGAERGPFWIRTRDLTVISRALSPTELKAPAGRAPRGARGTGRRLSPDGVPPGGPCPLTPEAWSD